MDKQLIIEKLQTQTKIDEITGCWLWLGGIHQSGHGSIYINGKQIGVHRLSAYVFHDLDLNNSNEFACHKTECINKNCWNPNHIYKGNRSSNTMDRNNSGKTLINLRGTKTHCKRGHEFTPENTYNKLGKNGKIYRECITCKKEWSKKYHSFQLSYWNKNK